MSEARIQHDLIMWFGQNYPQYRNLLFLVHNETMSKQQGTKLKSMGLIAGVSDLIFINPKGGKSVGIELKAPKSTHKKTHIQQQLFWGADLINAGSNYLITSNLLHAKKFIVALLQNDIDSVEFIQNESINFVEKQFHKKTIAFF